MESHVAPAKKPLVNVVKGVIRELSKTAPDDGLVSRVDILQKLREIAPNWQNVDKQANPAKFAHSGITEAVKKNIFRLVAETVRLVEASPQDYA